MQAAVDKTLRQKLRKKTPLSAKLVLMRLKKKAVGSKSVPQEKRHYLLVCHHDATTDTVLAQPMFFSSRWSVGKALDVSANTMKLMNRNNVAGAEKLFWYRASDGE